MTQNTVEDVGYGVKNLTSPHTHAHKIQTDNTIAQMVVVIQLTLQKNALKFKSLNFLTLTIKNFYIIKKITFCQNS